MENNSRLHLMIKDEAEALIVIVWSYLVAQRHVCLFAEWALRTELFLAINYKMQYR